MSEVTELIAEAKDLLSAIEADVEAFAHVEPDATQLRIATSRLRLFTEQHAQAIANAPEKIEEPEADGETADEELEALTRKQLNAKAVALGVETPEKLSNKDQVIAAIREKTDENADEE